MSTVMDGRMRREFELFRELFAAGEKTRRDRLEALELEDAGLAENVRRLLAAADSEHEHGAGDDDHDQGRVGRVVDGRFRLERLLGSGGMGEVYLAERVGDIAQRVALKFVRADLPIPLARARREGQILGRLEHPNIAGLIDAGITPTGEPWFAMHYVHGASILEYSRERRLDVHARARLMAEVCLAVQFAHRNLVLHRDIKPSNILVDEYGNTKLLDFGVAKLIGSGDSQQTQALPLTPAYASPEQMRGDIATTASDVYQLGVVAYELVTGIVPREGRLSSGDEGATFKRPDAALTELAKHRPERLALVIAERRTTARRLRSDLRGDFARIIAKATHEDPYERHPTAEALGSDLARWAEQLPVNVHRVSLGHRLRRLVARHRGAAAAIGLLCVALVVVGALGLRYAYTARLQQEHASTLLTFMQDVFLEADPENAEGRPLSASDLLERAAQRLSNRSDMDAETLAVLKTRIADVFNARLEPEKALASAEDALRLLDPVKHSDPQTYLSTATVVLDTLQYLDRIDDMKAMTDRLMPLARVADTPTRQWTGKLLLYRAEADYQSGSYQASDGGVAAAIARFEQAGTSHSRDLAEALNLVNRLRSDQGRVLEAWQALRRAIDLERAASDVHKQDLGVMSYNEGVALYSLGRFNAAMATFQPLDRSLVAMSGAQADTVRLRVEMMRARIRAALGETEASRKTLGEVLDLSARDPNADARFRLHTLLAAAKLAIDAKDGSTAGAYLGQTRSLVAGGHGGLEFLAARIDILEAERLLQRGDCAAAESTLASVRAVLLRLDGATHGWPMAEIDDIEGRCRLLARDYPAAAEAFARSQSLYASSLGEDAPAVLRARFHAEWNRWRWKEAPDALSAMRGIRAETERSLGTGRAPQLARMDAMIERAQRPETSEFSGIPGFF